MNVFIHGSWNIDTQKFWDSIAFFIMHFLASLLGVLSGFTLFIVLSPTLLAKSRHLNRLQEYFTFPLINIGTNCIRNRTADPLSLGFMNCLCHFLTFFFGYLLAW